MDMLADAALGSWPVADLPKHLPDERRTLFEQQPPDFTAAHLTDLAPGASLQTRARSTAAGT